MVYAPPSPGRAPAKSVAADKAQRPAQSTGPKECNRRPVNEPNPSDRSAGTNRRLAGQRDGRSATGPKKRNRRPANGPDLDGSGPEEPAGGWQGNGTEEAQRVRRSATAGRRTDPTQTDPVRRSNRRPAWQGDRRTNPTRSAPAPCPKPALRSACPVKGRRPKISRRPPDPLTGRADRGNDHKKGAGTTSHNRPEQPDKPNRPGQPASRNDLDSRQATTNWTVRKPKRPGQRDNLNSRQAADHSTLPTPRPPRGTALLQRIGAGQRTQSNDRSLWIVRSDVDNCLIITEEDVVRVRRFRIAHTGFTLACTLSGARRDVRRGTS
jgi:hypothetical protein